MKGMGLEMVQGGGGGYLESNMTGYFCDFIYEFGYADIYDHIIQYGVFSFGRIRKGRKA
jgi:hypothetical protein